MSQYDKFDFDNFDDSLQSADYRRRASRRGNAVGRRRAYQIKRRNRRRLRNRIVIVGSGILIVVLLASLLTFMFRGCDSRSDNTDNVSTQTKEEQEQSAKASAQAATAPVKKLDDALMPNYFVTPKITDDKSDGEMFFDIYVWNKIGFELFYGDKTKSETYAKTINGFADKLDGMTVYDMIVPNHTEMGLPQRLKNGDAPSSSQAESIKNAYAALSSKVMPINSYNYLAEHNSEYIYFNSDHHWTGLGAYYAYKAFADTNELEPLKLESCTEHTIEGFTGTFTNTAEGLDEDTVHYWELPYSVTMDITDGNGVTNTYDGPYYQAASAGNYTYGVFIIGDNPLTVLKSESEKAEKGKKIAVVKESYGNAFVPYLTYNYEEVHVIDYRTFSGVKGNLVQYCQENDIDEVLFINGIMSANTGIQLDSMSSLFK